MEALALSRYREAVSKRKGREQGKGLTGTTYSLIITSRTPIF